MASVGMEINQAETAFVWPKPEGYGLRWFTPAVEVDLCGHATLASAHVLYEQGRLDPRHSVGFHTRSGILTCSLSDGEVVMDFPAERPAESHDLGIAQALGVRTLWEGANRMDLFCVLESQDAVLALNPDFAAVKKLGHRALIVTAKSTDADTDYVCRCFAPQAGIDEDPVTGSAHCALAPYWQGQLGKNELVGLQASKRTGRVKATVSETRVILRGKARTVVSGTLTA